MFFTILDEYVTLLVDRYKVTFQLILFIFFFPIYLRYIDPSNMFRSVPANATVLYMEPWLDSLDFLYK
jgi:hypothetical protein